jgi:Pvc16 N-terminal domain
VSMLRDACLSLENWFERILPPGTGVRFDAPRADWEKRGSGSAFVSVFLCTVHRDGQDLPRSGWSDARDADGRLVGRQAAPRYYRLSFLITAWAAPGGGDKGGETSRRTLEEHELLGLLVDACTSTETIAQDHLIGSLAEAGIPCFVRCGGEAGGQSTDGLWSGFGIAPHAHLELEMVAPVVPPLVTELAPPAREIVVSGRQLHPRKPAGDAADSEDTASSNTASSNTASSNTVPPTPTPAGTVRRWQRTTIVEPTVKGKTTVTSKNPGTGRPGQPPQSGG